jgi:hypothetical protein
MERETGDIQLGKIGRSKIQQLTQSEMTGDQVLQMACPAGFPAAA